MRHLLSINDLSAIDAIGILDTATELARINDGQVKKLPTLRGRTIVNLFAEDSTRTRISFEAAAKRLSADVINFSARVRVLVKVNPSRTPLKLCKQWVQMRWSFVTRHLVQPSV